MQQIRAIGLFALKFLILLGLIASVYRMFDLSIVYLLPPFPTNIDFLMYKQAEIVLAHWNISFYIHISVSVLALATGLTQFSRTILHQQPKIHRWAGYIYVFGVLFLAAPTGLIMGFYGEGGLIAQIGFVFQALAWWWLTYRGFITIKNGQTRLHFAFILRSYAVAMSAITLRLMTYGAVWLRDAQGWDCAQGIGPSFFCHPNFYIFSAWFSWIFNWILAEILLRMGITNYYLKPKPLQ